MYDESAYHNIEMEDSRTRLIRDLTEDNQRKDLLINELKKQTKEKYDHSDPNLDIVLDIAKITKVITHLNKHMKLTRDVGSKARLGTSISNLSKTKNILVTQVIELEKLMEGLRKKDKIDHRYN